MEPSQDAIDWGKRQAERAPQWTDEKWNRIAVILGLTVRDTVPNADAEGWSDAA